MAHRVMVLGGYGFFGERICAALAQVPTFTLFIAGRDADKAKKLAERLGVSAERAVRVDAHSNDLTEALVRHGIATVINTVGPFQQQNYAVPLAAITAGCNYIDLADSREFVVGIDALDERARRAGVTVVSGASSVPALAMAVIDQFLPQFKRLETIRMGITSGARTPGIGTMRSIFSYCGKPFTRKVKGEWETTHGWLDLTRHRFPQPVGLRLLGSCNVPDLSLIPSRYPSVQTATFHAGFASDIGHLVVWSLSGLVRLGLVRSVVPFASILNRISTWIEPTVSDTGAMFVAMEGQGPDDRLLQKTWNLLAGNNDGPSIPCGAAVALTKKLAEATPFPKGAMPCIGLISVDEYLASLRYLDITEIVE